MRKLKILSVVFAFIFSGFLRTAFAADVVLSSPEKRGGIAVLEAIANRASAKPIPFEKKEISEKNLSVLLWAGSGLNRERGWTVPMARGSAPYVDIYVLLKTGVYSYDWEKNRLLQMSPKNLIPRASGQEYTGSAPCIFVFITKNGRGRVDSWADVAVGAMSQNIYLACEALGLKARYAATFNKETLLNNFEQSRSPLRIIAIMPVGYQK